VQRSWRQRFETPSGRLWEDSSERLLAMLGKPSAMPKVPRWDAA